MAESAAGAASMAAAFEAAAMPHLPLLYRLSLRLTNNHADAEDLVQEAFLRAFRGYAKLRNESQVKAWLCRILKNLFLDRCRKDHQEPVLTAEIEKFSLYTAIWDEDPFPYSDQLHDDFMNQFRDEDVRRALSMIPEHYRVLAVLRFVEGFSYKELSEVSDLPMGTVMSRLHRGRKLLEKSLWDCACLRGYIKEGRYDDHVRRGR